jgi:hypothetical protein
MSEEESKISVSLEEILRIHREEADKRFEKIEERLTEINDIWTKALGGLSALKWLISMGGTFIAIILFFKEHIA